MVHLIIILSSTSYQRRLPLCLAFRFSIMLGPWLILFIGIARTSHSSEVENVWHLKLRMCLLCLGESLPTQILQTFLSKSAYRFEDVLILMNKAVSFLPKESATSLKKNSQNSHKKLIYQSEHSLLLEILNES